MEDVLSVYARPYDENFPVVCMDEKPVQLFANARKSLRSKDGRIEYEDNEYIRNGTACIFMFTEPLNGWRFADAQEHRTREDWAKQIKWLLDEQYPQCNEGSIGDGQSEHPQHGMPCIRRLRRMKHFAWQAGWRSTTRPNMGVGWTLRRLSFLRLPVSVSERIVFLIWERSGICFNHGIRIGTRNRKVSTGNLLRLMPGLSSNGCTRQSTFSCYTLLVDKPAQFRWSLPDRSENR